MLPSCVSKQVVSNLDSKLPKQTKRLNKHSENRGAESAAVPPDGCQKVCMSKCIVEEWLQFFLQNMFNAYIQMRRRAPLVCISLNSFIEVFGVMQTDRNSQQLQTETRFNSYDARIQYMYSNKVQLETSKLCAFITEPLLHIDFLEWRRKQQ